MIITGNSMEIKDEQTLVVYEFDPKRHVTKLELPEYAYWQTVFDWGGVRDKTVALLSYYDFARAIRCIWREAVFPSNTPTDVIVSRIRELEASSPWPTEKLHRRWVDAPGQLQVDLYNTHGLSVTLPLKDDWESHTPTRYIIAIYIFSSQSQNQKSS